MPAAHPKGGYGRGWFVELRLYRRPGLGGGDGGRSGAAAATIAGGGNGEEAKHLVLVVAQAKGKVVPDEALLTAALVRCRGESGGRASCKAAGTESQKCDRSSITASSKPK